jgi:hypothetical protein
VPGARCFRRGLRGDGFVSGSMLAVFAVLMLIQRLAHRAAAIGPWLASRLRDLLLARETLVVVARRTLLLGWYAYAVTVECRSLRLGHGAG